MTRPKHDALDDLERSVSARRGALGASEQQALERAIEQSALLRVAHETGQSFDAVSVVQAGDEALIQRAAARVLENRAGRSRRRGIGWVLGVAAAVVVGSAGAAGLVVAQRGRALETARRPPPPTAPKAGATPTSRERASAREPTSSPATVASSSPPFERPRAEQAPSGAVSSGRAGRTTLSAAELFRDAAAARRAGDFATTRALYAELQARFPGSNEARVSQVSLGKLLLGAGKAREAAQAFDAYLASGGGQLGEEAFVGRANALQALGNGTEERLAWQALLRKYPGSVYRAQAEARIAALDAARDRASE